MFSRVLHNCLGHLPSSPVVVNINVLPCILSFCQSAEGPFQQEIKPFITQPLKQTQQKQKHYWQRPAREINSISPISSSAIHLQSMDQSNTQSFSSFSKPAGAILLAMPMMSHAMKRGTVSKWLKQSGDEVEEYDVVFETETSTLTEGAYKVGDFAGEVTMLVEAAEEGFLVRRLVEEGAEVEVGGVVAVMCEYEEEIKSVSEALDEQDGKLSKWLSQTLNVYKDDSHGFKVLPWQCYLKESMRKPGDAGCM